MTLLQPHADGKRTRTVDAAIARRTRTGEPTFVLRITAALSIAICLCSCAAMMSTYSRLSQTWDEPNHVATGLEWLQDGRYTLWTENPPLARLAVAIGPFLGGARLPPAGRTPAEIERYPLISYAMGDAVLNEGDSPGRRLVLARAGTLPFFIGMVAIPWFWFGRTRPVAAFLSVATICTLPPMLGHGALATTDVAFAAMFMLYVWRLVAWFDHATPRAAVLLGLCLGLAVATKFTALIFVPTTTVAFVLADALLREDPHALRYTWAHRLRQTACVTAPTACVTVWAVYGFAVGSLLQFPAPVAGWIAYGPAAVGARGRLVNAIVSMPMPAPAFFNGVLVLFRHNAAGHATYALGQASHKGIWYFYPLALSVKTPFAFMVFVAAGLAPVVRRMRAEWWVPGLFGAAAVTLLALSGSSLNLGLRHVLILFPMLSSAAAVGLATTLADMPARRRRTGYVLITALLSWQTLEAARSHPNYLSYFNALARDEPGYFLVDSDLDWGQGVVQLREFLQTRKVKTVHVAYNGTARLCDVAPEVHALPPNTPTAGWVAVSEAQYREVFDLFRDDPPCELRSMHPYAGTKGHWFTWLDRYAPEAIIADSIRVYHIE